MQAVDDPSLVIEADKVWKRLKGKKGKNESIGKYLDWRFQHPQDRLLTDLAVASRLFKPIERSVKLPAPSGCLIDVNETNSFLTESVWLLKESGYVILLPSWWNDFIAFLLLSFVWLFRHFQIPKVNLKTIFTFILIIIY